MELSGVWHSAAGGTLTIRADRSFSLAWEAAGAPDDCERSAAEGSWSFLTPDRVGFSRADPALNSGDTVALSFRSGPVSCSLGADIRRVSGKIELCATMDPDSTCSASDMFVKEG
ncbi:hypothetical protein [Kitasatospora sp. NPDC094015]|uniref:hypothetical protein n=1 Tax=Kitasatospora sp. NPDC094015 TaxID=3155205 RepID=UPI00332048B3